MKENIILKLKNTYKFILIFNSIIILGSCSFFKPYKPALTQGNIIPESAVQQLQTGLSKSQVQNILGPRMFKADSNTHWEYHFYTTKEHNKKLNLEQKYIKRLTLEFDNDGYLNTWKQTEGFTPQL